MSRKRKKDEARAAAKLKRQAQAERNKAAKPVVVGGFNLENTSDVRVLAKAVRQRWAIPEAVFSEVPKAMRRILKSSTSSVRSRIMASKTLAAIHGQNEAAEIEVEKLEQRSEVPNVNVNVGVIVREHDDWYGTRAASGRLTASDGPPTADPVVVGPV